jgi:Protein of unknown function (DUF3617)
MRALLALSAVLVSSTAYAAMDIPARKAGLWQMTMNFEGGHIPQQSIRQCIDAATDKMMNSMGGQMTKENCSKQDMQRVGNTIVVDSVCKSPMGGTNVAHAVVSGDFNSAYTVKVDSRQEGGQARPGMPPGGGAMKMTVDAKWVGPCAADQKPGDMIMSNGMKMNVRDMPMGGGAPGGGMPPQMPRR